MVDSAILAYRQRVINQQMSALLPFAKPKLVITLYLPSWPLVDGSEKLNVGK
jgi:hypothetical protein